MPIAFLQGLLGASSLLLGAVLGIFWQPSRVLSATIMAFGSGTLLSAIAFEITLQAFRSQGFWPVCFGFILGGTLFATVTAYIDQQGGFLRKPASRRRYLFQKRQEQESAILDRLAEIEVMQNIPAAEARAIAPLLNLVTVEPQEVICEEGAPGDCLYMILTGVAEVLKDRQMITTLGPGEVFGEMALLTGEPRSATVIAQTAMELYQLQQQHFDQAWTRSPHLAQALSRTLAHRLQLTTASRAIAEKTLSRWRRQMIDPSDLEEAIAIEPAVIEQLVKHSAPWAILIGTLLDGIPESTVIGMGSHNQAFSGSFLLAVLISNFPEALSSATGMKQAGTQTHQILGMWLGVVLISGCCALGGSLLSQHTSEMWVTIAQSISGGAILAMIASTMMPEAYELGGVSVAFSTILGFLTGLLVASPHL